MRILTLILVAVLTACGPSSQMAIHGDSTALASRDGMAKIYNLVPTMDSKRWWNIVAASLHMSVYNDGVGGQNIRAMRDKMLSDNAHRAALTIIYDRRNDGEDAAQYVIDLADAIGSLQTDHFLIMPQVARSVGSPDDADQMAAMAFIDDQVLSRWPEHTFSRAERAAFLAELASDATRIDFLHRNELGQEIEARWIGNWLAQRGW